METIYKLCDYLAQIPKVYVSFPAFYVAIILFLFLFLSLLHTNEVSYSYSSPSPFLISGRISIYSTCPHISPNSQITADTLSFSCFDNFSVRHCRWDHYPACI